ncbi:MAG: amidophosphoribosyltransferase [Robiginitomaculum sp.]|nr:MAG: amidophosphoribosyltransferase [Robiginitomaculum sp.]
MNRLGKSLTPLRQAWHGVLQQILPAVSPLGLGVVSSTGAINAEQWRELEFLSGAICHACGAPVPQSLDPQSLCLSCESRPPRVARTRSALVYSELSKRLILGFKHGDRADSIEVFANWMAQAAPDLLRSPGILIPVPLHLFRRMQRKFNQSALLGNALSRNCALPHEPLALVRRRNTPSQALKSGKGRARNVSGAFRVPKKYVNIIKGQRIILIDDVRTSGATLDACATSLLAAGAAQIDAITLARVVKR